MTPFALGYLLEFSFGKTEGAANSFSQGLCTCPLFASYRQKRALSAAGQDALVLEQLPFPEGENDLPTPAALEKRGATVD